MNYDRYVVILIIFFVILMSARLDLQPFSLDIYYHLAAVLGFDQAGGITTYDFWEFAPVGRPHLYPPLLHILMLMFYKLGISLINIGKIFCFVMFPAILFVVYWVCRKIFSQSVAFATVLIAVVPYSFFVGTSNNVSASLAIILSMLAFYAMEKKRKIAAGMLLGLSVYTNIMISVWFISGLLLYGFFKKDKLRPVLFSVGLGIVISSIWIIHILNNISFFKIGTQIQADFIEVNPLLYVFMFFGAIICWKKKRQYLFPLALLAITPVFAFIYPYRFISAQGMLPVILVAGFGLESFFAYFCKRKTIIIMLTLLVLFMFNFMIAIGNKGQLHINYQNSTFTRLSLYNSESFDRHNDLSLYNKWIAELAKVVKINTAPDDIIFTNYPYIGGTVSVLSERATSSAMLYEIAPKKSLNQLSSANVIVWIKNPENKMDDKLVQLIGVLKLEKLAETEIAYVYKNPTSSFKKRIIPAILPLWLAFMLVFVCFSVVIWDFKRKVGA